LIEIVLIVVMASLFFALAFFALAFFAFLAPIISMLTGSLLVFLLMAFFAHVFIFLRIARLELYPYATLRLERFNLRFYRALILSSLVSFALLYLVGILFPKLGLSDRVALASQIIGICLFAIILMLVASFPLSLSSLTSHKRARLSFRAVLVGLKLLSEEQTEEKRSKLVKSHIKWFGDGLRSYNRFLYKFKPVHMEIMNIDDYYRSVCCVSLIGNQAERDIVMEEIRRALDSVGGRFKEEDFRQLLIGLRNIKNMERNNELELSELNDLVRVLSFSERLKERVKSPYFEAIVAGVEITVAVLVYVL